LSCWEAGTVQEAARTLGGWATGGCGATSAV